MINSKLLKEVINVKVLIFLLISILLSCSHSPKSDQPIQINSGNQKDVHKKPTSTYQDSIFIDSRSAVFYQPDSLQLEQIRLLTNPQIFEGSMHEYFYQVRNAHNVLRQNWPKIQIIDTKNVRFLVFGNADRSKKIIDLNDFGDAYGMFLFDTKQAPVLVDMTNLEEGFLYFSK